MSVPERRPGQSVAPRFQQVKRAMTESEYQAMGRKVRRAWWPVIRQAIRLWEDTEHPGSVVMPGWMPVQALVDVFIEHGIDDVDAIVATILKLEQMTGDIVQRTLLIDGVNYPVVKLTDYGRAQTEPGGPLGLPAPTAAAIEPRRPELEGPP